MEVLSEVSVTFPDTKDFIDEKLEQKCAKKYIPVEEVIIFHCFALLVMKACL